MKKFYIYILMVILLATLYSCKGETSTTQTSSTKEVENHYVYMKEIRFYLISIQCITNCGYEYPDTVPDRDHTYYITGADLEYVTSFLGNYNDRYLFTQYTFKLDLSKYENNEYYIDEITVHLDGFGYQKTIKIDKNFVYVENDKYLLDFNNMIQRQDGFNSPYNYPVIEDAFYLSSKFFYHDLASDDYSTQSIPLDFQNENLELIEYNNLWLSHERYDGYITANYKTNQTFELIYPTVITYTLNNEEVVINDANFYFIGDFRVIE